MTPHADDRRPGAKATARLQSIQSDVFTSSLHDQRNAAILGSALGVMFTICFLTGMYSYFAQHPPSWFLLPSRPAGLYRVTQGLHVATGLASIPLLFAKLWTVYPKLFQWPPFSSIANALERLAIFPLIAGSLFLLFTGLANINLWYPWKFFFPTAHYWAAWITIGALIVHLGAKWPITRRELRVSRNKPIDPGADAEPLPVSTLDRRRFLGTVFGTSAVVTLFTLGQTVRPLRKLALLAPRRPDTGIQGFPVNQTAGMAGVINAAQSPNYRLSVTGNVRNPLSLTLDDLQTLPRRSATLPIACVEGWSTSQQWTGIPVRDLLLKAGAPPNATVRVMSLEDAGRRYSTSDLNHWQAHDPDTLLALHVNGEPLALDHGYPLRLIGPNRPGVMQTKWVTKLVVR
jgi:hypothetical protein